MVNICAPEPSTLQKSPLGFNGSVFGLPWTVVLTILFFCMAVTLVWPFERLPINDEFVYGQPTKYLLTLGHLIIPSTGALGLPQILVCATLCSVFGFSYSLLRVVGLVFAAMALASCYLLIRETGLRRVEAGAITFVLATNPFFLCLANSCMTEIPTMAFSLSMLLFLARACRKEKYFDWIFAGIFLGLAILSRQSSLAFLPGAVFLILFRLYNRKSIVFPSICIILVPLFCYLVHSAVWKPCMLFTRQNADYERLVLARAMEILQSPSFNSVSELMTSFVINICYVGLWCLPILVPLISGIFAKCSRQTKLICFASGTLVVIAPLFNLIVKDGRQMAFAENLFNPPFLGAYCLVGAYIFDPVWRQFTTFAACVSALLLSVLLSLSIWRVLLGYFRKRSINSQNEFVCMFGGSLVVSLATIAGFVFLQTRLYCYDRYFLIFLPFLLPLLALVWRRLARSNSSMLCIVLSLAIGVLGLIQVVDNHNFCKAKEQCIMKVERLGFKPLSIDGGYEYNFEHNPRLHLCYDSPGVFHSRGAEMTRALRWWPINSEEVIVATRKIPGYHRIAAASYYSPLLAKTRTIWALRKRANSSIEANRTLLAAPD